MGVRKTEKARYRLKGDPAESQGAASSSSKGNSQNQSGGAPETDIRLLVIMNEQKNLMAPLGFLKRRGYRMAVVHNMVEAIQKLPLVQPQAILVSWNLKRSDVKKIYNLITKKFDCVGIVFAEENNTRTSASLMSSGIPNTLLAPVSGPGIHMRIQALLKKKHAKIAQATERQVIHQNAQNFGTAEEITQIEVKPDVVDSKTEWSLSHDSHNPNDKVWRGVCKGPDGKNKVYHFKGPVAPHFNEKEEHWQNFEKGGPILFDEHKFVPMKEATQEGPGQGKEYSISYSENKGNEMSANSSGLNSDEMKATAEGVGTADKEFDWSAATESVQNDLASLEADLMKEFSVDESSPESQNNGDIKYDDASAPPSDDSMGSEFNSDDIEAPDLSNAGAEVDFSDPEFGDTAKQGKVITLGKDKLDLGESGPGTYKKTNNGSQIVDDFSDTKKQTVKKDKTSILAQGVREAVEGSTTPSTNTKKSINMVSTVTVVLIETSRFKGYLVGGNASDLPDRDLMVKVYKRLQSKMEHYGEPLKPTTNFMTLEFDPLQFMLWVEKEAEFVIESQHGDDGVTFAYVPQREFPPVTEADNDQVFGVDLAKGFVGNAKIFFDLYLHMPKNKKYLMYLKKDSRLSQSTIDKLLKFNINTVYVRTIDKPDFERYCAHNHLTAKMKQAE